MSSWCNLLQCRNSSIDSETRTHWAMFNFISIFILFHNTKLKSHRKKKKSKLLTFYLLNSYLEVRKNINQFAWMYEPAKSGPNLLLLTSSQSRTQMFLNSLLLWDAFLSRLYRATRVSSAGTRALMLHTSN